MRLLLIACSATKRHDGRLLPARERYQGVVYRVISANWSPDLLIWIVSAKFGLISERRLIPDYQMRMSCRRAAGLSAEVSARFDRLLRAGSFSSIFINLGKNYARTLDSSLLLPEFRNAGLVEEAHGGIGFRLQQTKQWLLAGELAKRDGKRELVTASRTSAPAGGIEVG